MVTKKIYRKKSRKSFKNKKSVKTIAKRALRMVKAISPEVKYMQTNLVGQQFNTDPTSAYVYQPLGFISQGDGDTDRTGDKINLVRHTAHFTLMTAIAAPWNCRITCVQLLQNTEGLITATSIGNMFFDSNYTGTQNIVNGPTDYDNRHNFRVLYDKVHTLNPTVGTTAAPVTFTKQVRINLRPNRYVQYFHTGNTITKNEIFWFFTAQSNAASSQVANVVFRTYYTDS